MKKDLKIAVAGTGYVGLSIATLLSQHHHVTAVDVVPEKVDLINCRKSPIQDEYIEKYLAEKDLDLVATLDGAKAYGDADFVDIGVLLALLLLLLCHAVHNRIEVPACQADILEMVHVEPGDAHSEDRKEHKG